MFDAEFVEPTVSTSKLKTQEEREFQPNCCNVSRHQQKSCRRVCVSEPDQARSFSVVSSVSKPKPTPKREPKTIADIAKNIEPIVLAAREQKANKISADVAHRKSLAKKILERRAQSRILAQKPEVVIIEQDFKDGKTILETNTGCWFPVGPKPAHAADQKFCAKPQADGSLFCSDHKELAIKPALSRAR